MTTLEPVLVLAGTVQCSAWKGTEMRSFHYPFGKIRWETAGGNDFIALLLVVL